MYLWTSKKVQSLLTINQKVSLTQVKCIELIRKRKESFSSELPVVDDTEQAKSSKKQLSNVPFALSKGQEPGDKVFCDDNGREERKKKICECNVF